MFHCLTKWIPWIVGFFFLFKDVGSKKYDLDGEALKLYGETFSNVLQRFRRSSEYVKILQDKEQETMNILWDMMESLFFYKQQALLPKVHEYLIKKYGSTTTACDMSPAPASISDEDFTNITAIQFIDIDIALANTIPAADRNAAKTIAFNVAKSTIKSMLNRLDGEHVLSTKCNIPEEKTTPGDVEDDDVTKAPKKKNKVTRLRPPTEEIMATRTKHYARTVPDEPSSVSSETTEEILLETTRQPSRKPKRTTRTTTQETTIQETTTQETTTPEIITKKTIVKSYRNRIRKDKKKHTNNNYHHHNLRAQTEQTQATSKNHHHHKAYTNYHKKFSIHYTIKSYDSQ